ncbi:multicomponent Na+:H+ antiporter subunit E [Methanolinea mesophila]|uniref:Na+/H+ antiporter subunit E n=1 Tax=Methanolinea mesophila TaxID=547055 RepID=UPI0031586E27|nr:multicomponent Na+:H+ antiporter subunit E [Methanolinea mesophila]
MPTILAFCDDHEPTRTDPIWDAMCRGDTVIAFLLTTVLALFIYLLLTAGSGDVWLWSPSELVAGVALAVVTGGVTRNFLCRSRDFRMANPARWLLLPVYVAGPFLVEMAKANLDVAYRVITGRIRPGIIKVKSGMNTDLGMFLLANSITLTPGTITVDIDEETRDLYVHNINIHPGEEQKSEIPAEELFSLANLPAWIRRIAE